MTARSVADDWWPEWLQDVATEDPLGADPVVVAAIEETQACDDRYQQFFTALVPLDSLRAVIESPGGIGYQVTASGPHPAQIDRTWQYTPRFWVVANSSVPDGLEPLVVSWQSGSQSVLLPDQGFLMTYGLVPRLGGTVEAPVLHWDDPARPRGDVVVAKAVSTYRFPAYSGASVAIARDFLQDYATIRNRAVVQVYYAKRVGSLTDEVRGLLDGKEAVEFHLKGRLLDLRLSPDEERVLAQVWGVRKLLDPGAAPISAGRWDYGVLQWPGFPAPVTRELALAFRPSDVVYVCDSVLAVYEGRPEFSIHPEHGAVFCGNQWSVSWTRRVGRDLIAVELKKLYEGTPPEVVRHWNGHAVARPGTEGLGQNANVATRARRIVYRLANLGEVLARISAQISGVSRSGADFTGLDRRDLDYRGWWTANEVQPITRHIPAQLTEAGLLGRCSALHQVVGEGLSEARLRDLLHSIGIAPDDIRELRSFKLLGQLTSLAELASRTGLPLTDGTLHQRQSADNTQNPIARLFALYDLRQLADHRAGTSERQRFDEALQSFGLNPTDYAGSWGLALDAIYDGVGEALEVATAALTRAH